MSDERTITIEVDGRRIKARPGAMLIDVTDDAGIPIPRFCYHKKLSVAANCRMCLVEVDKVPKPLPACATPVSDGMKVLTRSPRALAAQKGTMEFLLINHPLDCPICDQGGECELQDVAVGYGGDVSRYVESKRVVRNPNLGPLIATDMTRCIHCTRCVRFGAEIAGIRELGATGRGEHMHIGTYIERSVDSELSGNIIDLCPVGALTSKPFRFKARAWELVQVPGIAPHDSVGSNINLHIQRNKVMRVHPRDNEAVNESWISDRDRFSYEGLNSDDRLLSPMVKDKGEWREVSWQDALDRVAEGLGEAAKEDPEAVAAYVAANLTLEELYLAQKVMRGLGSNHIDHRLRQIDFRADDSGPTVPWLGCAVADLESVDAALVIGSNMRKEQPLLAHRLRKAAMNGAKVRFVNPLKVELNYPAEQIVSSPSRMLVELAAVAKALDVSASGDVDSLIGSAAVTDAHTRVADALKSGERSVVLLGNLAASHPDYALIQGLARQLADATGSTLGYLPSAANSVGAALAGAQPSLLPGGKVGAGSPASRRHKAYLLAGVEMCDFWDPVHAGEVLSEANFVVAMVSHRSSPLEGVADVLLPTGAFAETSGTFVNAEGVWQSFSGAVTGPGNTRPGWKVLRVLGNVLGLEGFDYGSSEQVREELAAHCKDSLPAGNAFRGTPSGERHLKSAGIERVGDVPLYAQDILVRRAASLQKTWDAIPACVMMNPVEAQRMGLAEDEKVMVEQDKGRLALPLVLDEMVPEGCARIPAGVRGSEALAGQFGPITLVKV